MNDAKNNTIRAEFLDAHIAGTAKTVHQMVSADIDAVHSNAIADFVRGAMLHLVQLIAATPEPTGKVDDRVAYIEWLETTWPNCYQKGTGADYWRNGHLSALAWKAARASPPTQPAQAADESTPANRDDLERVLSEWNDTTGALPVRGSWYFEVLGMLQDAFDIGATQQATPDQAQDISAGSVAPGSALYEVTHTHRHETLKTGDLVRMTEDPRYNNLLLRTDHTLHTLEDKHGQHVHLRSVTLHAQANEAHA